MTKKDYEKIAKCIRDSIEFGDKFPTNFIARLVNVLEEDNEKFNSVKFIEACYVYTKE